MFGLTGSYNNQTTNSTNTQSGVTTNNQTGSNTSTSNQQAYQDPLATQFRQGLFSSYGKAINDAQGGAPIYGTGFVAGQEGQNAEAAKNATDSLKQTLAATGGLDSGAFASGASNIAAANMNQNSQLRANLPAMEAQAKSAQLNPLLSGASGLAATSPTSYATTGESKSTLDSIITQLLNSISHSNTSGFSIGGSAGIG